MRKLFIILLFYSSAFAQYDNKPMLGVPIDPSHHLGDPVGAWFFNEGLGNIVYDLSGNGNHGTLVADTHWVPGKYGSALDFDGTGDVVDTGIILDAISLTEPYTVVFLVAFDAKNTRIIAQTRAGGDRFGIAIDNSVSPKVNFSTYNGVAYNNVKNTTILALDRTWYHFACVGFDHNTKKIYLNGVDETVAGIPISAGAAARNLYLGDTLDGLIGHVLIYNRALSASEVAELYPEPFCMMEKDEVALMTVEAPAPTGGQVITIQMTAIKIFPILLLFTYVICFRRKNG